MPKKMLDRLEDDITITRKLANGTSMTLNSPQGAQTDLTGLMRNLMNQGGEASLSMDSGNGATVKEVRDRIKEAIEAGTSLKEIQKVVQDYARNAEDEDEAEMVVRAVMKMIKKMKPMQQPMQPEYHQFGGFAGLGNIFGGGGGGLSGPYAAQAQQLQQAGNQQSAGALSGSALAGLGTNFETSANLLATAGKQGEAQDYKSSLGALGQGWKEHGAAQAEVAKGRAGLLGKQRDEEIRQAERLQDREWDVEDRDAAKAEREAEEAAKKAEEEAKLEEGKTESLRLLNDAKGLIGKAGMAGDILNGFTPVKDVDENDSTWGQLLDQAEGLISGAIEAGADIVGASESKTRILVSYILSKKGGKESYNAYVRLSTLAKNLVKPLIASGILGRTSDGDIKFAESTIFDPKQPSSTWSSQISDAIARVKGIAIDPEKEDVPVDDPANNKYVGVPSGQRDGNYGPPASSVSGSEAVDNVINKGWSIITGG